MREWKAELDAFVAETEAFTNKAASAAAAPRPQPQQAVERIGLNKIDWGWPEREEIRKRVENFRAH